MTKLFLFDIEGTTTDINFVHNILFPYSYEKIESFILNNLFDPKIKSALEVIDDTIQTEENKTISVQDAIEYLKVWIKEDRKHPSLKKIQGLIWEEGYKNKHFHGHVYPEIEPFFKKIKLLQNKIGIYSSGSVLAQKLLFGHSSSGDLNKYIDFYFDTNIGHKQDSHSYQKIVSETQLAPSDIHFFSDILEELFAARRVGISCIHVQRDTYHGAFDSSIKVINHFEEYLQ